MRKSHSDIQPIDIGDLKMFQHYYTELYEELMYFLSSYIEDAALREDLIQDVWMKLWENRTRFQGELALKTYVYHAVRNAAISHLRKNTPTLTTPESDAQAYNIASEEHDMLAQMIESEVYSLLNDTFNQLPPSCKNTYIERLQGKSLKEIAETMGITTNTVKKHINNANHFLRKKLSKGIFFLFSITPITIFLVFI